MRPYVNHVYMEHAQTTTRVCVSLGGMGRSAIIPFALIRAYTGSVYFLTCATAKMDSLVQRVHFHVL